jgi:GT2 family glycosyltransferase
MSNTEFADSGAATRAGSGTAPLSVTVIVPTYRRPDDLERCLKALAAQTRVPDRVIVTVRRDDPQSRERALAFSRRLVLDIIDLDEGGQVAALNAGIETAVGDVIAITDDDAVPHSDWVERIERHYRGDDGVGAVGGRDYVYNDGELEDGARSAVGKVQWFGRVIGNHHLGFGPPRDVDVLKGANWSFRRKAAGSRRFNTKLKGTGAQVGNDLDFCLQLRKSGWRLVYDPSVAVDHYPAVRHDLDQRGRSFFHPKAKEHAAHNDTLILLSYLPPARRLAFAVWSVLVGTAEYPGLAQMVRLALSQDPYAVAKTAATLRGRWAGLRTWRETKP